MGFKPLVSPAWGVVAVLVAAVALASPAAIAALGARAPSPLKPFADLRTFRGHYEKEHQDETSVKLHVTGTSMVLLMALQHPEIIMAGVLAAECGCVAFAAFRHLDNGLAEALVVLGIFFLTTRFLRGSLVMAVAVLVCGYAFAWTGHFFYEQNRPATFIYPTYSLISDFLLWAEVILGVTVSL